MSDWVFEPLPELQFAGTTGRSARNNNPFNLEYRPGTYQDKYGATMEPTGGGKDKQPRFGAYPNMLGGYLAGLDQIRLDQQKGHTLASFVEKFAPRFENPTDQLIAQYARATGASPDTPLAQIPAESLAVPMLKRESSTRILNQANQQLAAYHQTNQARKTPASNDSEWTFEYADQQAGNQQPGFLGQTWTGLKEQLGSYLPKYGSFISGAPESTYQQEYQKWKDALGEPEAQPETWWGKVGRGLGQGVGMVPEFMALNAIMPGLGATGTVSRMAQSALPFAASSLLNPQAGVGDLAHSAAMGVGLGAIPPSWGRMLRVPAAAGVGGGMGYLASGDIEQASADAAVLAILSALHGGVPRAPEKPRVEPNIPGKAVPPERRLLTSGGGPGEPGGYETPPTPPLLPGTGGNRALPLPGQQRLLPEYLPDFTMPVETRRRPRGGYQAVVPPENYPLALEKGKGAYTIAPGSYADMVMRAGAELPESAGLRTGPLPGMMPDSLAEAKQIIPTESALAPEVSSAFQPPPTLAPRKPPTYDLVKAEERHDLRTFAKAYGPFNSDSPELRNLELEERKSMVGMLKKGGRGMDDAFASFKNDYPHLAAEFNDEVEWVRAAITRKPLDMEKVWREHYDNEAELEARAREEGLSPEALSRIEADVAQEIAAERTAEESATLLKRPALSPEAVKVKKIFTDISDAQAELLAADPELRQKYAKGDWDAIDRVYRQGKISDAGAQKSLPGSGGLFDESLNEPKTPPKGPTPDSLRAGLNLEDLKFLGRKVADLGDWLSKQFDRDTRYKVKQTLEAKGTPKDIRLDPQDISMWRKYWDMPEWLQKEYPNFLNVAINNWRQKIYNNLKTPWFKEASPVFTLPRQQWDSLRNLMVEADQMSRRMLKTGANREQIDQAVNNLKAQYGPEVQNAAESWWRTGSRIWRTIDDIYSRMGMGDSELDQLRREMGFVPYYFPHMRFGKYLVMARQGKDTLYAEGATNRLTRDRLMADLKKKYPSAKVDYFESKGIAEEVFFGLNDAHAAQLAKAALAKAGKLTPEVEQGVMQALANSLKERGFGRQFIQQKNIPGFESDDFHRVLGNYISGAAGFISKLKAAPEHVKALGAIDAKQQPRLYSYAEKYVRHSLQNASKIDEVAGKMRGLMFHYFLGFNPKSATLNLTQNTTTGAPVLSTLKVKNPGVKILTAVKDLAKDGKAYWNLLHGQEGEFKTLKDNEVRALRTAMDNGWLDSVYTDELMGMVGSRLGTSLNKFEKASHFLFGQAESLNRAGMFLASFRELTKKGVDFNNAVKKANDLTTMSHFAYGKYNLPEPVRDLGPIGRTVYTFRSFSHNYALLLRHLAKRDPAAFGRAIRNLAILGGLKAVPLVGTAFGIYKALTGTDLWQEGVQDKENNLPYLLARFGVPGLAGIDMSGSVSIEVMKDLKQWSDLPKELLGAVGGIGENLANAADSYKRGDYYRMGEDLSPQAVRNVMGAYRKATEGVTTRTGRQVFDAQGQPVKLSTGEAVGKGLGFQPVRPTIQREINDYLYNMRQNQQELGDKWASRMINALRTNDRNVYNQVMTEVMDYNQRAVKRGEPPIEIENYLKRRMQPQLPGPKKWLPYYQKLQ